MSILRSFPEVGEETSGSEIGDRPDQTLENCIQEAIEAKANCEIHAEEILIFVLPT